MARIDRIVGDIYRISTWNPDYGITFNQFLVADERPALIHTGLYQDYEQVRKAVSEVIDPARLEYVALLHFEGDECGGMDRFLEAAPNSTLLGSFMSVALNLSGWSYRGRFQGFQDGDTLDLGKHKLRFLETPHVHHWDSMMVFDETTKSLFPSDLFIQPGEQPPTVTENLGSEMCGLYRTVGIFAHEGPVRRVVERVEGLRPQWVHPMHGGSLSEHALPYYVHALDEQPFAYEGKLLGRDLAGVQNPSGG
ncbi:MAG: MBL fold metallo-hydrolase [Acidimicrobiaceae bacterium]|nr:MBL fold metallo-hydrolase [Acidimicrobiaceae bacterium]